MVLAILFFLGSSLYVMETLTLNPLFFVLEGLESDQLDPPIFAIPHYLAALILDANYVPLVLGRDLEGRMKKRLFPQHSWLLLLAM